MCVSNRGSEGGVKVRERRGERERSGRGRGREKGGKERRGKGRKWRVHSFSMCESTSRVWE